MAPQYTGSSTGQGLCRTQRKFGKNRIIPRLGGAHARRCLPKRKRCTYPFGHGHATTFTDDPTYSERAEKHRRARAPP